MRYEDARIIADRVMQTLAPYCQRIEIAGSVRRQKSQVKDIEVVAVPRMEPVLDLFGNPCREQSMATFGINRLLAEGARTVKGGDRYVQLALPEGINLDLFLVLPPAQWGVIFTIRTGPADFSKWMVTKRRGSGALPSDCDVRDGVVWRAGAMVPMPEEKDFFEFCGVDWIEPQQRASQFRYVCTR